MPSFNRPHSLFFSYSPKSCCVLIYFAPLWNWLQSNQVGINLPSHSLFFSALWDLSQLYLQHASILLHLKSVWDKSCVHLYMLTYRPHCEQAWQWSCSDHHPVFQKTQWHWFMIGFQIPFVQLQQCLHFMVRFDGLVKTSDKQWAWWVRRRLITDKHSRVLGEPAFALVKVLVVKNLQTHCLRHGVIFFCFVFDLFYLLNVCIKIQIYTVTSIQISYCIFY